MNVSTKSEYGLRALIYLTGSRDGRVIPAREIAEKWKVPIKYLEQILKTLKEAGERSSARTLLQQFAESRASLEQRERAWRELNEP